MMKHIALLGSTGSIGRKTIAVAEQLGINIVALAACKHSVLLEEQIETVKPKVVALFDKEQAVSLQKRFPHLKVLAGQEGLCEVASMPQIDGVVVAITGMVALAPTLAAIYARKVLALASKEVLVSAGDLIMQAVKEHGSLLIPVDSEHSAIFQCLQGQPKQELGRLIITASGGPFFNKTAQELETVNCEQALKHPVWQMGTKISIDSSTLMNKALEVIEAYHLFDLQLEQIDVLIHPQSIVHCLVQWVDGNFFAHMHPPDMVYPIQYALTYPNRQPVSLSPLDFTRYSRLEFFPPDRTCFPTIDYAKEALKVGKSMACYLNAANEVLVNRFLQGQFRWKDIFLKLETLLHRHHPTPTNTFEQVLDVDHQARQEALLI